MIRAARPAPIILSPLKKKILYEKMPVIPRRITGIICFLLSAGKLPSIFHVKKTRQTEATANLKNDAEYGSTFCATILPAINVPPQIKAVRNSLIYTSNGSLDLWFFSKFDFRCPIYSAFPSRLSPHAF